jgi:hypothetical protein
MDMLCLCQILKLVETDSKEVLSEDHKSFQKKKKLKENHKEQCSQEMQ